MVSSSVRPPTDSSRVRSATSPGRSRIEATVLASQERVSGDSLSGDLIDRLNVLADRSPDLLVYIELIDGKNESARLPAAQLRDQAVALAASLSDRGIERNEVVLLIATPPLEFLVGLFGCMWAGVIAAPISFPRRPEHLESRLEPVRANAGAVGIIAATPQGEAEEGILDLLTGGELPVISIAADPPESRPARGRPRHRLPAVHVGLHQRSARCDRHARQPDREPRRVQGAHATSTMTRSTSRGVR